MLLHFLIFRAAIVERAARSFRLQSAGGKLPRDVSHWIRFCSRAAHAPSSNSALFVLELRRGQLPPYFPTTGCYYKNRYYEIDPVGFSVADWFAANR